jgi:hypothetical protein
MADAKTIVKYNEIPEDSHLLKKIKPLKRGEQVTYRLHGCYDPDRPNKFFGRTLRIPPTDLIMDKEGNTYDIAMVKGLGPGGVQELDGEVYFEPTSLCLMTLNGSNAREMRRYQYMEICNFNGDNPDRNPSSPVFFEKVNEERDRGAKRDKFKRVVAAMEMVEALSEKEVLDLIRANRLPDTGSHQRRLTQLENLAQKDPDKLLAMPLVDHTALLKVIEDAVKAKVIVYSNQTRDYTTFDKTKVIHNVKTGFSVSPKVELAKFLLSPEGHADLDWIKSQLKSKE